MEKCSKTKLGETSRIQEAKQTLRAEKVSINGIRLVLHGESRKVSGLNIDYVIINERQRHVDMPCNYESIFPSTVRYIA